MSVSKADIIQPLMFHTVRGELGLSGAIREERITRVSLHRNWQNDTVRVPVPNILNVIHTEMVLSDLHLSKLFKIIYLGNKRDLLVDTLFKIRININIYQCKFHRQLF